MGRVASAFRTFAIATTGVPASAVAAKQAASVVEEASDMKKVYIGAAAALGGGNVARKFSTVTTREETAMVQKIDRVFGGAMKNKDLVNAVASSLKPYGYGESSLVVTSLCVDEVNRQLEHDFVEIYKGNFRIGGLSGFPFGGLTAFVNMASNIPNGGSCLLVFGPHVGVDSDGTVGTVQRRGRKDGGPCCGSAVAAATFVLDVLAGRKEKPTPSIDPIDAQQDFVTSMLLPYAAQLDKAPDKMVELPYALYDAQKKLMNSIVHAGYRAVKGDGKIAVLGGIQINTPPGESEYYLPLSFELFDNKGKQIEDLMFTF